MRKLSILLMALFPLLAGAQTEGVSGYRTSYTASVTEFIFSMGSLGKVAISPAQSTLEPVISEASAIPRFTGFFHLGEQFHYNFNNSLGFFTGISLRNTGMINRLNDTIKLKQRVYSIGVPLALKIGNMGKPTYVSLGGELELFFNYKQKTFLGTGRGDKIQKFNSWFSNRTELLNPSVFIDFNFGSGNYIRLKYYLNDFLDNGNQNYRVHDQVYTFTTERSTLFSLSLGKVIVNKKK